MLKRVRWLNRRSITLVCLGVLLIVLGGYYVASAGGSEPTELQATRINPGFHPMPAFQRTVNDAQKVQRLYAAALSLSKVQGVYSCPFDDGIQYQLRFLRNGTLISTMLFDASGCEFLQIGDDDTRITVGRPDFQSLLAQTLGLSSLDG